MSSNSSTNIPSSTVNFYYVFTLLTLAIFIVVAFVGNLIVLIVFAKTKELRSVMNYFLMSLALADFLTAIFPLPIWFSVKFQHHAWPYSKALLKTWRSFDLILCTASIWNLCAISIDRCLAIAWPFLHRVMLTPFRMKCAIAAVWLYSILVSVLITDYVQWKHRGLLISCLSFYIPAILIIAAYLVIYITELKARFELQRHVNENDNTPLRRRCKQDLKMAKYMILLITCFMVCWAGHFIMGTYFAFGGQHPGRFISDFIKAMTYFNSCVNPFLYGYVSPKFRAVVVNLIRKYGWCPRARSTRFTISHVRTSQRTSFTKCDERRSLKETGV